MFSPLRSALVSASRLLARASLLASFRKERESQRAGERTTMTQRLYAEKQEMAHVTRPAPCKKSQGAGHPATARPSRPYIALGEAG